MYLSKVTIHGSICRNPYEIHRALWQLFPANADAQRDYLFRVEKSGQQLAEILLQSRREPVEQNTTGVRLLARREYTINFDIGQRLRFLLLANPVKTISDESSRLNSKGEVKKCRVPLVREEEWKSWLERKLEGCAELEALLAEKRLPITFRKAKEKRIGKVQPVIFQGVLSVKDPSVFLEMIRSGIGPAKAFGCGLLSIARV